MRKTCLWLLLISLILACFLPVLSLAEETEMLAEMDVSAEVFHLGGMPRKKQMVSRGVNVAEAKAGLHAAILAADDEFDARPYNLKIEEFRSIYTEVLNAHPELFYVDSYSYYYNSEGIVSRILLRYTCAKEEIAARQRAFNAELDRIVDYASAGSTPLLQALLVNDYFCTHYQYDTSYSIYDPYTLFTQKKGVCQAYMEGYTAAMNRLGIPVRHAVSDKMNHTWNLIQIDGQWYHVDVTWNDPVADKPGRARHAFFLCSDSRFRDNPGNSAHYDWIADEGIVCGSMLYDNAVWREFDSTAAVFGSSMYIITGSNGNFALTRWQDNQTVDVHTYSSRWYITDGVYNGYFYSNNMGALGSYGDYLLYSTYQDVWAYSLADGSVIQVYTVPDSSVGIFAGLFIGKTFKAYFGRNIGAYTGSESIELVLTALQNMILPAGLMRIEENAFEASALERVICSSELTEIGARAFADCAQLVSIEMGAGVQRIAEDAFAGCSNQLAFVCPDGSYAARYAQSHGFRVMMQRAAVE